MQQGDNSRAVLAAAAMAAALAGCSTSTPAPHIDHAANQRVVCSDISFPIYFDAGSDQLAATARQELAYAASHVKGCRLGEVEVLGLSGGEGNQPQNLELARRRANMVAQALTQAGLPAPVYDVQALGALGSRYRGRTTPLSHKAQVVIHAAPSA